MIKRILQKIKTKKLEKSENFFQSGDMKKKSRLRAFARTRAKNKSSYYFRTYELLEMIQMFSRLLKILRLIRYAKKYYCRIGWEARLAGRPDWLGGQIGWEARLAGRPDWIITYPSLSQ
jgi:hypothetical protein